jgi:cytoskeletal protein RodZ
MNWADHARHQDHRQRLILAASSIAGVAIIIVAAVLLWPSHVSQKEKDETKSKDVISRVSDLFVTPSETPLVVAIEDKEQIADNKEFFKNAVVGDYLVVYRKAGMAVIYRENVDKIVNAGSINGITGTANAQQ